MAKIDITFNAMLGGAVKATFESLQNGLKDLAKFLKEVAKAELELGNAQTSQALGQMARGVNILTGALNTSNEGFKNLTTNIHKMELAQATWANKTTLVQQAWATFSARMMEGSMTLKEAENRTRLYDNAIQKLEGDLKLAGVAGKKYADSNAGQRQMQIDAAWAAQALNKEITLQTINQLKASGAIKLTAQGFKILNDSAYQALLSEERYGQELTGLITKLKQVKGEFTSFVNERNKATASGKSDNYLKGLSTINLTTTGKDNIVFEQQVKILKQVENALLRVSQQNKTLSVAEREAYTNLDRFNIVSAVTNGHLKVTAQGIQVLSGQGLKALGNMSIETANKMGVLDKSFLSFDNKMKSFQKITGLSDAVMKALQSNLMASGKSFADLGAKVNSFILNSQKLGTVTNQVTALNIAGKSIASGPLKTSLEAIIKEFEKFAKINTNPQKIADEYKKVGSAVQDLVKQFKEEQKAIEANKKAEQDKITQMNTLRAVYGGLLTSQTQYGDSARRLMAEFARTGEGIGALRGHLSNLNRDLIGSERGAFTLETAIASLGRRMRSYAYFMISSATINAMTQAFSNATTAIIDHDQALHNLVSITQATQQQEKAMADTLSEVATTTKFNLEEVAYGMQRLAQGGFTTGEIIQAIKPITDLATGTMESLGQTVDLVSTAIYSFGLNVAETPKVVDIFANAVTQSRLTVDGLNTAMNYVGPVAHMAGVSLEDTMVILEMFANSGMRASTQGTALRRLFESLLTPSKEFKEAIKQAGMSLEDFNPTITPIEQIIDNLPKVVHDATDAFEMFGTRGANAVSVFAKQGSAEFLRLKAGVLQSGTAVKMAAEQMEGLKVTLSMVAAKVAELAVAFGKNLVPFVKGALDALQGLLTVLIKVGNSGFGTMIAYITSAVVAFGALSLATKVWMTYNISAKILEFWNFTKVLLATQSATMAFNIAGNSSMVVVGGMATAFKLLITSVSASIKSFVSLHPIITLVGLTLTALVVAWQSYKKQTAEVIQANFEFEQGLTSVKTFLDSYNEAVKKYGAGSKEAAKAFGDLKTGIKTTGETVKSTTVLMEDFSDALGECKESGEDAKDPLEAMANILDAKLAKSLDDSAEKMRDFLAGTQALDFSWKLLKGTVTMIPSIILAGFDKLMVGITKVNKSFKDFTDRIRLSPWQKHAADVSDAMVAYEQLKESAKEGGDTYANALNLFEKNAESMTKGLMKSRDALNMTRDAITELAVAEANRKGLSDEETGALIVSLQKYVDGAKEAKKATDMEAASMTTLSGVLKKLEGEMNKFGSLDIKVAGNFIGDFQAMEDAYYQHKLKMLDDMDNAVKNAAITELGYLKIEFEERIKLVGEGSKKALELEQAYETARKQLIQTSNSALLDNVKMRREIFLRENKDRIGDLETHYNAAREVYDKILEAEVSAQKDADKEKLTELSSFHKSSNQMLVESSKIELAAMDAEHKGFMATMEQHKSINDEVYRDKKAVAEASVDLVKKKTDTEVKLEGKAKSELYKLEKEKLANDLAYWKSREAHAKSSLDKLRTMEQSLVSAIKSGEDEIFSIEKDTNDKLRELRYEGQASYKNVLDEKMRMYELEDKYKKAMTDGDNERAKDYLSQMKEGYVSLASMAKTAANEDKSAWFVKDSIISESASNIKRVSDLQIKLAQDEKKANEDSLVTVRDKIKTVSQDITTSEEAIIGVMTKIKEFTGVNVQALIELNDKAKAFAAIEMFTPVERLNQGIDQTDALLIKAKASADALVQSLLAAAEATAKVGAVGKAGGTPKEASTEKQAESSEKVTTANESQAESGDEAATALANAADAADSFADSAEAASMSGYVAKAEGGPIPGYGGGDTVPAMLERGEWVIRKEAVRAAMQRFGSGFMQSLNSGTLRGFKYGGEVTVPDSKPTVKMNNITNVFTALKDFGTVKINTGDKIIPVIAHQNVVAELTRHMRRESLMGAN